jgi:hypothetical protein
LWSVTTALTSPWLLSRATSKPAMLGGAAVEARTYTVQRMICVTHSSRKTVPAGATAPGSKLVSALTTGASLVKARSLTRRPTASASVAPSGSTSAVAPSP